EDVCDRLIIMYGGKIRAEGTVDDLLTLDGRQAIEVEAGEPISRETVERIEQILSSEGKRVAEVRVPRQRLETLFMEVIERATAAGEATTGAGVGGDVAGFLAVEQAEGEALLEQLSAAPQPAPTPVEPAPAPEARKPDQDILEQMAGAAPRPEAGDAESARPA